MSDHIKRLEWLAGSEATEVWVDSQDLRSLLSDVERMRGALELAATRLVVLSRFVRPDEADRVIRWSAQARQALSAPNTEEGE